MESADLRTWTRPETIFLPDEADLPEFYGMPVFRRGNLFFGLLQVYNRPEGTIEIELAFSSDGRRWERVQPRELFLTRGSPGEFDAGMVVTANSPVIFHDEMRFYYGGIKNNHNEATPNDVALDAIGMASVPMDRLYGVTTSSHKEPGFVLTRLMALNGTALELNARIEGQIKVALLDVEGKPIPGYDYGDCKPLKGDNVRHRVAWGAKKLPEHKALRIKLQMEGATLYAMYLR